MENKEKKRRGHITIFRKSAAPRHFEATRKPIITDPQGSYTGTPVNGAGELNLNDLYPTQDADDL